MPLPALHCLRFGQSRFHRFDGRAIALRAALRAIDESILAKPLRGLTGVEHERLLYERAQRVGFAQLRQFFAKRSNDVC